MWFINASFAWRCRQVLCLAVVRFTWSWVWSIWVTLPMDFNNWFPSAVISKRAGACFRSMGMTAWIIRSSKFGINTWNARRVCWHVLINALTKQPVEGRWNEIVLLKGHDANGVFALNWTRLKVIRPETTVEGLAGLDLCSTSESAAVTGGYVSALSDGRFSLFDACC